MKQVKIEDATKSEDWECVGGLNAGADSYRVYESESKQEKVVKDGKDKLNDLKYLRNIKLQK
jgi:hypothetical protein